jgi:Pyridine nucleotide-disulphide oxidoreductase
VTRQVGATGNDRGPVRVETVVIGAGQAALPGMRVPAPAAAYPTKDEMADFLETYAATFELPVRTGVRVRRLAREDGEYLVTTDGSSFRCDNVVVASGTFGRTPYVPDFAGQLDPGIVQLHSSAYKNPAQLQPGRVLVVGASHSGGDIADEAGLAGHPVVLSGRIHGEVPFDLDGRTARVVFPVMFFAAKHVLTIRTPLGRQLRPEARQHGGPLIRVKRADLTGAGVELAPARTAGVRDGLPALEDGRVVEAANVVWCTGFRSVSWASSRSASARARSTVAQVRSAVSSRRASSSAVQSCASGKYADSMVRPGRISASSSGRSRRSGSGRPAGPGPRGGGRSGSDNCLTRF